MCFRVHTTLERFSLSLSLSVSEAMEVCTSSTSSPQARPMEVCVCALRFRSLLVRLASHSLSYIRTYFHRVYVDSIYPLSKESSVCVCVCVDLCLSLSFSLKWRCVCTLTLALAHPLLSHFLFPFFSPIPLSLSLSLYVVLPHVSYPTFYLFLSSYFHLRPQNRESTVSRPICEVKHGID